MDKCCRWCRFYDNSTGYCFHDDMFEVHTEDGTDIVELEIVPDLFYDHYEHVDELRFKVKNPEEFSCCCWE